MRVQTLPAAAGWRWLAAGFAIFRRNPPLLALLVVGYWLTVLILNILTVIGAVAATLVIPGLAVGLMQGARDLERGQSIGLRTLFGGLKTNPRTLMALGALYQCATLGILGLSALFDGGELLRFMLSGKGADKEVVEDGNFMLPSLFVMLLMLPVLMAYWFAPVLAAWHGQSVGKSLFFSFVACWINWREGVMETWYNGAGVANYMGDYEPEILSWSGGIDKDNCSQCFNTTNFPFSASAVNDVLPAVGMRHTINGSIGSTTTLNVLKDLADTRASEYAMVVKGIWGGVQRGFYYMGSNNYQPDQNGAAAVTHSAMVAAAQAGGAPLTWTLVHPTTKIRHGVDRDMDGIYDFTDGDRELALRLVLEGAWNGTAILNCF